MSMVSTSGIRGRVGPLVTPELALGLGEAIASDGHPRVVVGRDVRDTGRMLVDALSAGLCSRGADVCDIGMTATPTLARSVDWVDAELGVMVTASHNPPEYNGFKFWDQTGRAMAPADVRGIVERMEADSSSPVGWNEAGIRESVSGMSMRHVEAIVGRVGDLTGLSVVVDVGNGAGGVAIAAFEALGADVTSLFSEPDGSFPNRASEPTVESCRALRDRVVEDDADMGVALDGDADRMLAVTESGRFVPGDVLLALFGNASAAPGEEIAISRNASIAVEESVRANGVTVRRTPIGDAYIGKAVTEAGVTFGGEPSGAWIWSDDALCPDGPFAACRLAALVARRGSLDAMVEGVDTYPLERHSIPTSSRQAHMEGIRRAVRNEHGGACETEDGVYVEYDDGWYLIRPSGTEPVLRLTAEAATEPRVGELMGEAKGYVEATATG